MEAASTDEEIQNEEKACRAFGEPRQADRSSRISIKNTIAHNLIEERVTMAAAIEDFQSLNRMEPELVTVTRATFASQSEEEATALQVINYVRVMTPKDERIDVSKRMDCEFPETLRPRTPQHHRLALINSAFRIPHSDRITRSKAAPVMHCREAGDESRVRQYPRSTRPCSPPRQLSASRSEPGFPTGVGPRCSAPSATSSGSI